MASHNGVPRSTFAKLSPSAYLLSSLSSESPARANSRRPSEARPAQVNAGSLTHANGSALVRVGDTTALCGVRAETLRASDIPAYRPDRIATEGRDRGPAELLDYNLLVPNIELATGSAPQFLPGGPPSTLAQTLSSRVYALLHGSRLLDVEELRIWHAKPGEMTGDDDGDDAMEEDGKDDAPEADKEVVAFWVLYIDIFFISYDGNPFDVAWTALIAALKDTKLPQVRWDPDREKVLVLPGDQPRRRLTIRGLPLACTAGVFAARPPAAEDVLRPPPRDRAWVLLDPDRAEEELCEESITAVVDCLGGDGETRVLSLSKHGGLAMGPEVVREYVDVAATQRWGEFAEALQKGARD